MAKRDQMAKRQPKVHRTIGIKPSQAEDLLGRLVPAPPNALEGEAQARSVVDRFNAAIGCKTDEVALRLLAQVAALLDPSAATATGDTATELVMTCTAILAELEPENATQALLATQMVGTQRAAMTFLQRAVLDNQTTVVADANVLRATRLMRLFNEQVETMAKLKGKAGQQRVVVEHVTVQAGGQAVVGAVTTGGSRGAGGTDQQ